MQLAMDGSSRWAARIERIRRSRQNAASRRSLPGEKGIGGQVLAVGKKPVPRTDMVLISGSHARIGAQHQEGVRLPEPNPAQQRRFQLILIKPSHYDDDGYVIRWWRAMTPSNSLAAVYGIAADCAARQVLGPDVAIDIQVIDETNTRVDIPGLLAAFERHGKFGCVALIGVQSNQ